MENWAFKILLIGSAGVGKTSLVRRFIDNEFTENLSATLGVDYKNKEINIDIYIIIEYGTRIKSVAATVANTVRYQVEKSLGVPVNEINIHVQDLRISNDEE